MKKIVDHRRRAIVQIIVPIVISILILGSGYGILIPFIKNLLIEGRKHQTREMVVSIYSMIDNYYNLSSNGAYSEQQAKAIVIETVKSLRYGDDYKDYFWLLDHDNNIISHPYYPDSISLANANEKNKAVLISLVTAAVAKDEDFIEYNWQLKDNTQIVERKVSFVKNFKPWNWVVGTGFYIKEVELEIKNIINIIMLIVFIFLITLALFYFIILRRALYNVKQIILQEDDLLHSEERFRGMAQNINSGLIIQENDQTVFFNSKIAEILGLAESEMNQSNIYDFIAPEEKDRLKTIINDGILKSSTVDVLDFWILSKDNKRKYVTNYFSYVERNSIKYTYILTTDITENRIIESRIKALSETLDQSPDSTVITDLYGNISYVNKKFEQITGYSFEEVKGQNPRILKSGKMLPSIYVDLWKTVKAGNIWENDLLNKKKNGDLFWEHTLVFPIRDEKNEIVNYASIKTDLTKQKQLESELIKSKEEAKVGEKIKTTFLNNISHEVRTPLNAINGFSALLKRDFNPDDEKYEYLTTIIRNTDSLLNLFQDIIDYSSIEAGNIKIEKTDIVLYDFIHKIASKYNVQIATELKKPIEIIVDVNKDYENAVLITDSDWFYKIIENILSNAIKYTHEGVINIGFAIDYACIEFYIKDTGVGISPDEQMDIFEPFNHGNNLYISLHKGIGLGLNIANKLIGYLGGKLWYNSIENSGTTFYFSLPSIDVKNYTIGNTKIKNSPYFNVMKNKKVIIAEDNEDSFFYIKSLLHIKKTDISWAKNGNEVLSILENSASKYDLILMDMVMPELDGLQAGKIIKNTDYKIPIIAMLSSGDTIDEASKDTFDAILSKPFQKNQLYEIMNDVFSKI